MTPLPCTGFGGLIDELRAQGRHSLPPRRQRHRSQRRPVTACAVRPSSARPEEHRTAHSIGGGLCAYSDGTGGKRFPPAWAAVGDAIPPGSPAPLNERRVRKEAGAACPPSTQRSERAAAEGGRGPRRPQRRPLLEPAGPGPLPGHSARRCLQPGLRAAARPPARHREAGLPPSPPAPPGRAPNSAPSPPRSATTAAGSPQPAGSQPLAGSAGSAGPA